MPTPRLVGFCGTSWRPAKARALVEAASHELAARHGLPVRVLDLVDAGAGLAAFTRDGLDHAARGVIEAIEAADGLVIGCPVFQGSYPGLFKHVFDLIGPGALKNRPVLLTAVGGGLRHSLVVEHQLRPLFGFFEACTVSTAVYAGSAEIADGTLPPMIAARLADAVDQFAAHLNRDCADAA
ncbi:NAD(P)H-dependent oxidoreductase [Bradyrhizobium sp. U87765 SZCCT0131]|uniref:NAD(P)H-dependent oxidoreductase n=1 Tax=unclassified Bradyrhizobium TaxID=2631580 RepID=UPI001BABFE5A|nr:MULTISPECIES: NAD(P)H-dependent oxidoreductase [unclassified Bradyrhizobium]MBR1218951.1 NAD(P)H-dependent oxidoreductase [Bradyrhizobium sp. U87765 SZCCT0131]MBR1261602.1 NAD(P)H-dependent oxidoreductase [Bradyrhizobium sp. U87765 SZCCT0134]MBR1306545.1 NAD(P)H-dependent oxidoreductase [Bradyrhizobium sp. U87765 SZCCT0110]MBR1317384.1 NAD(P)H-dependent oxidoreductase [Bradyrhizobium sp. U87765 SZCCT0109]MBR1351086.1 NAD(P)H-dependent oxidoreductase [Bradyrhizobium sp. U87765 SZCCT0048]